MSKIALIGNGNVGSYFRKVIAQSHHVDLYTKSGSKDTHDRMLLNENAYNFILLAVPDDAIEPLARLLKPSNAFVVHFSGSTGINALGSHKKRAVIYPLQTFTKEKQPPPDFPIFIESEEEDKNELFAFVKSFHDNVHYLNSSDRLQLHISAVFASNFYNHLLHISEKLLAKINLDLAIVEPLVHQTLAKALEIGPERAQTGPAKRGDQITIRKHIASIEDAEKKNLYIRLTESIQANAD